MNLSSIQWSIEIIDQHAQKEGKIRNFRSKNIQSANLTQDFFIYVSNDVQNIQIFGCCYSPVTG